jgi:Leucine-rich repeat (LRR) protein
MKKIYFLVLALFFFNGLSAQVITFKDSYFKNYLISSSESQSAAKDINGNNLKVDLNNNGEIEESELLPIASLKINSYNVRDLTGLSKFVNLTELDVSSCSLTTLDLSGLKNLKAIKCDKNALTVLNLTGLTKIESLDCSSNSISALDLINLIQIKTISVAKNKLTTLNVLNLKNLESLIVENNLIKTLDTSNLANLSYLSMYGNPLTVVNTSNCTSLKSINFESLRLSSANISGCTNLTDLYLSYSRLDNLNAENCTSLVKLYGTETYGGGGTKFSFRNCKSLSAIKMVGFSVAELDLTNCSGITSLECNKINVEKLTLSGCTNLKYLEAKENILQQLNLSDCINLEKVAVEFNKLTTLLLTGKKIQELTCNSNLLTDLNLSGFDKLVTLNCSGNKLTNINTTGLSSLKTFTCQYNLLTNINVNQSFELEELNCTDNNLISLDVSKLSKLKRLAFVGGNFALKSLNASGCVLLEDLFINNPLEEINLSGCTGLKYFYLVNNANKGFPKLTNLDLSNCTSLLTLEIKRRTIGNLDITNCSILKSLNIGWGAIDKMTFSNNLLLTDIFFDNVIFPYAVDLRPVSALTYVTFESCKAPNIDISDAPNLVGFSGTNTNALESVNLSGCTQLKAFATNTKKLNLKGCTSLKSLYYDNNSDLETLDISGCSAFEELYISYKGFYLLNALGCDKLKSIQLYNTLLKSLDISNYPNLNTVGIADSKSFTSATFSNVPLIKNIRISNTSISELNLQGIKSLENLNCDTNLLTSLNIKGLTNLTSLSCQSNKLTSLDISESKKFTKLYVANNQLSTIDVTNMSNLDQFECSDNLLSELDFTGSPNITYFACLRNKFTTLNLNVFTKLASFNCVKNDALNSIYLNNLNKNVNINAILNYNPNLKYICVDESRIAAFQNLVYKLGYFDCHVNSYCSFTPNGAYTVLNGNMRLDINKNGCETTDVNVSNIKFTIKNNSTLTEGTVISEKTGSYSFPIQEGNYEVLPILENPSYFNISPKTLKVIIPVNSGVLVQDFCLTPDNTAKNDLEIELLPIDAARPGFDVKYKVVYKNKGNSTLSGVVNLFFDNSVLDLILSNPQVLMSQNNNASWNFTNLKPFENRGITLTFNVNGPTEIPVVNNGDILKFVTTIASQNVDETPSDNTFTLNQTVVGSYDPNDKTCLEGSVITPNLIGEYVHYMIRFENTGTYPAQNIVVKDMIDLSKFDISTLIPTSSSHSFVTKISEGNKVEFIFENINLPFDDATNDGYIAFKIKTKPTLKVGDSFTNEANIYFDYNFPILTNKATSKFETTLGNQDFTFSNYFALYPVPASEVLNITRKNTIEVQSIAVYDVLGQLVIAIPNAKSVATIDISNLKTGNYFIKVKSDKGTSSMKFIKK